MHHCHINWTSVPHVDRVQTLVKRTRAEGAASSEAHPRGFGMTGVGDEQLWPERLAQRGPSITALPCVPTGEKVVAAKRAGERRKSGPGGPNVIELSEEGGSGHDERSVHADVDRQLTDGLTSSGRAPLSADPGGFDHVPYGCWMA